MLTAQSDKVNISDVILVKIILPFSRERNSQREREKKRTRERELLEKNHIEDSKLDRN